MDNEARLLMFRFPDIIDQKREEERNNLKFYSPVSILIGYLRNSLAANTASGPSTTKEKFP